MAVYIAAADGNLTTAATWETVDATSYLYSAANNTALTTSYVESAAFTPGAITIDGIAVHVASRSLTPTATVSIRLAQAAATVAGTEVTINVSDIDYDGIAGPGWVFFKFAAPVLLVVATAYTVSAKASATTQINLFRNATAGNWSRALRTTVVPGAAPGAGDEWHVLGEWTAAGVKTDRVVAPDSTAATDYGSTSTDLNLQSISVGKGGTLAWPTTASTSYILQVSGGIRVAKGGIVTVGTVATPMPITSTATIQFDCAADGDFGLLVQGTFTAQGVPRTSGKNVVQCLLNTDEAIGQTVLGVDTDTGWLAGDVVVIASTSRTSTAAEAKILNAAAGASSIEITVALAAAHSGTSPTQAEVINVTRNVVIKSVSTTAMAFVVLLEESTVNCDWVQFLQLGSSTDFKRGLQIRTGTSGSCEIDYCSVYNFENYGIHTGGTLAIANVAVRNTVIASQQTGAAIIGGFVGDTEGYGSNVTLSGITIASIDGTSGARDGFNFPNAGNVAMSNLRVASVEGIGMDMNGTFKSSISGIHIHSCGGTGLNFQGQSVASFSDLNVWRCTGVGLTVANAGWLSVDSGAVFGNLTRNFTFSAGLAYAHFKSLTVAGDTSFAVTEGYQLAGSAITVEKLIWENCSFGPTSGIFVPHTSEDADYGGSAKLASVFYRDTVLGSTAEEANTTLLIARSSIHKQRSDGTTNVHTTFYPQLGTIAYDTAVFRTLSPSEKMSPTGGTSDTFRLRSAVRRVPITSGSTAGIQVYVRKTSTYAGNSARLVMLSNAAIGFNSDVVVASHSAAADTWQLLSGTTAAAAEDGVVEFVVECDGTAGAVYTDDWQGS